jgi:hypothetical protein
MKTTTSTDEYVVSFSVLVDAPERRQPDFHKVRPGTLIHMRRVFFNQAAAVSHFNGLCRGEEDFASECVTNARVSLVGLNGEFKRVVRKRVELNQERAARYYDRAHAA